MSESGADAFLGTAEGWALTIGQPVLVLLVFALYFIQAWTAKSHAQVSVNRRKSGGVSLSLSGATGRPDRRNIPVAWADAVSSIHNSEPTAGILALPPDMTKKLVNQIRPPS
jgi:hypothetical protein